MDMWPHKAIDSAWQEPEEMNNSGRSHKHSHKKLRILLLFPLQLLFLLGIKSNGKKSPGHNCNSQSMDLLEDIFLSIVSSQIIGSLPDFTTRMQFLWLLQKLLAACCCLLKKLEVLASFPASLLVCC